MHKAQKRTTVNPSPYEQGKDDFNNGRGGYHHKPSSNPYLPFSDKWAQYNRGYNAGWMPRTSQNKG